MRSYNSARKCPFNDVGLSTDLSDNEDSSAQNVALQVAFRPAGLIWLIGYFGKCRIYGFGDEAKLDQFSTNDLTRLDSPRIHTDSAEKPPHAFFLFFGRWRISHSL